MSSETSPVRGRWSAILKWFAALTISSSALLTTGCATWTHETIAEESVQQVTQFIDLEQTLSFQRHHLAESDDLLGSALVVGHHPSDQQIIAYKLSEMALHGLVTDLLEREHWNGAARAIGAGADGHAARSVTYIFRCNLCSKTIHDELIQVVKEQTIYHL